MFGKALTKTYLLFYKSDVFLSQNNCLEWDIIALCLFTNTTLMKAIVKN